MSDILPDDSGGARPNDRKTRERRSSGQTLRYDYEGKRSFAWRVVEELARRSANDAIRLASALVYIKRTDPEPSKHNTVNVAGPLILAWREPQNLPQTQPAQLEQTLTGPAAGLETSPPPTSD